MNSSSSDQKMKNASKKLIQKVDSEVREAFTLFDKVNNNLIFYLNLFTSIIRRSSVYFYKYFV